MIRRCRRECCSPVPDGNLRHELRCPAGPEWRRRTMPLPAHLPAALHFDEPLRASKDGFTLHAATHAGDDHASRGPSILSGARRSGGSRPFGHGSGAGVET